MKWHADRATGLSHSAVTLRLTAADCFSPLRSILARARANVIGNALCYGKEALLPVRQKDGSVEAMVVDKGPGIRALGRDAVSVIAHPQDGGHGTGIYHRADADPDKARAVGARCRPRYLYDRGCSDVSRQI